MLHDGYRVVIKVSGAGRDAYALGDLGQIGLEVLGVGEAVADAGDG